MTFKYLENRNVGDISGDKVIVYECNTLITANLTIIKVSPLAEILFKQNQINYQELQSK